jgi:hypothetical protein
MTAVDIDLRLVVAAGILFTIVLWAAAVVLGRVDGRVTLRGFRNGGLIALILFLITVAIVTFVFNGRAVFVVTLDLAGAFGLGLLVGAVVALGYVWLGGVLIAVGLIFRSKPQWTTLGAWAAVPVIVVAAGFGYTSYRSVASDGPDASTANGSMHLVLSSGPSEPLTADGAATCTTDTHSQTTISTGTAADPHIITSDGRLVTAQVTTSPDAPPQGRLTLSIEGLETDNVGAALSAGSSAAAGQMQLSAPQWTGTLTWSCNQ